MRPVGVAGGPASSTAARAASRLSALAGFVQTMMVSSGASRFTGLTRAIRASIGNAARSPARTSHNARHGD